MIPLLDVRGLRVELPGRDRPLVDDLSFALPAGACLGLVGASGSGKSMTAAALLGLLPRAARLTGSIRF
ncbi:MAG TPA: ATP-binding cassette domain-containing protein, partial [Tahibacter sp.]|nr:ATP-binding cassette domain-containing protein [Tahibacter sp.]